eukprot:gene16296-11652_t
MRSIVINPQGVLPYGLSDWTTMRQKECMYVDRTQAIAELDTTAAHACLWGPRRTGKSLLANQLALWHDKAVPEVERTELFAGTYIGRNPTASAGQYLVLALDFSKVDECRSEHYLKKLVNAAIQTFSEKYRKAGLLNEDVKIDDKYYATSIANLARVVESSGHKLSVIVDAVDSFAYKILLHVSHTCGLRAKERLDIGSFYQLEAWGTSVLRDFCLRLNLCGIERTFFTGVLPVAWPTGCSSIKRVMDLTDDPAFQKTLGFKSSDIDELLALRFPAMDPNERAKHLAAIHRTCNGYRRSSSQVEALYNPQGVWFYLDQRQNHGDQMVPHIDPNVLPPVPDEVVDFLVRHAAATNSPVRLMDEAIPYEPLHGFSTADLFDKRRQPQALLSMAHYLGYLTVQYPKDEALGNVLVAPNEEMRSEFTDSVLRSLPKVYGTLAVAAMAKDVLPAVAVKDAFDAYLTGRLSRKRTYSRFG